VLFVIDIPEKLFNKYADFAQKVNDEAQVKDPVEDHEILTYILTNNRKSKDVKIYNEMNEIKKVILKYDSML